MVVAAAAAYFHARPAAALDGHVGIVAAEQQAGNITLVHHPDVVVAPLPVNHQGVQSGQR